MLAKPSFWLVMVCRSSRFWPAPKGCPTTNWQILKRALAILSDPKFMKWNLICCPVMSVTQLIFIDRTLMSLNSSAPAVAKWSGCRRCLIVGLSLAPCRTDKLVIAGSRCRSLTRFQARVIRPSLLPKAWIKPAAGSTRSWCLESLCLTGRLTKM